MVSEVQRTWGMDSFELQDNIITHMGASKIPCNDAENNLNVMEESVEGHDSHVVTSNFKVKFPDFLWCHDLRD